MNKQRVSVLLAAGAGIVGTLMPWVTVSMLGISQSENGLDAIGQKTIHDSTRQLYGQRGGEDG